MKLGYFYFIFQSYLFKGQNTASVQSWMNKWLLHLLRLFLCSLYCYSSFFLTSPRECFQFEYTLKSSLSEKKMPFQILRYLFLLVNLYIRGHLAIPCVWQPLDTGLTLRITPYATRLFFFLNSCHFPCL